MYNYRNIYNGQGKRGINVKAVAAFQAIYGRKSMRNWKLRAAALAVLALIAVSCIVSGHSSVAEAETVILGDELGIIPGETRTITGKTIKGLVIISGGANVTFDNCTFIGSEDGGLGELGVRILDDDKNSVAVLKNATFMLARDDGGGDVPITVSNVFSGGTVGIDSVMTSGYCLTADGVYVQRVNNDTEIEENERLIDAWISISWYDNVLMYKTSFAPDRAGLIATHNVKVEYTKNLLYFPNVLEISEEKKPVTVDFQEGHEELAAQYASENGVPVNGAKVSVQIAQGTVMDAEDELWRLFIDFFNSVNGHDKGEKLFSEYFALKPMKDYSELSEFREVFKNTAPVDESTVFYLTWVKPIAVVNVTVEPLVCGQYVTANLAYEGPVGLSVRSAPVPSVTVEGDAFAIESKYHNGDVAFWADNENGDYKLNTDCDGFFKADPARGGDECYAAVYLAPKMGYYFPNKEKEDEEVQVFINGNAANNFDDERFTGAVPVVHPDKDGDGKCDVCSAAIHKVTVTSNGHGNASASGENMAEGDKVRLYAVPDKGYRFKEWKVVSGDTAVSGDSFLMPDTDVTIEAVFEPDPDKEFAVTLSGDGNGKAFATPASGPAETPVTLRAEPNEGFRFKEWKVIAGNVKIEGDTFILPAEDVEIMSVFEPVICKLTVALDPPEGGSADGGGSCNYGTYATLSAQPAKGYEFTGWVLDGSVISKDPEYNFKVTADGDYTATFAKVVYIVTKGAGGTWLKESSEGFTVAVKRSVSDDKCFDHFTGVSLDGKALAVSAYTAEKGSTIVTIGTGTLEALPEGDHTVTVEFDDGEAEAAFRIAVQEPERDNPNTGADDHFGMLAVMSALSLGAALYLSKKEF